MIARHRILILGLTALLWLPPGISFAAEARPWLCRDKPVFSNTKPMVCEISRGRGGRWRVFFMQFEPGAAHDGYETVRSEDAVGGRPITLPAGQYFVVAMHRSGQYWICPASAESKSTSATLADLCFSTEESDACGVRLKVRRQDDASSTSSSAPPQ